MDVRRAVQVAWEVEFLVCLGPIHRQEPSSRKALKGLRAHSGGSAPPAPLAWREVAVSAQSFGGPESKIFWKKFSTPDCVDPRNRARPGAPGVVPFGLTRL